ncbi:MAG: anaerobic ribonucleoside-triphosphate reductase activating protein [Candidatus Lokiarchaeota archaeon]|nr:anaerobic ribonucleoside-triphosphate reductase activating protein [Candidatus Lokiarchaeota archaeon]MBD3201991.1 anaerobic ribonucleoside-triphosphate reductase activating protein [Candidatus Lokiarchaeota archaeon]
MKIGGFVDISTKDIPGKACMVIFTVGCNFNCNFCHNKYLLLSEAGKIYQAHEITKIVKSNKLVNSISITGGEPTLQEDLLNICKELKDLNIYISIDTNGSNPELLEKLIPFIDRVALDLKAPLIEQYYRKITNSNINIEKILKSYQLINSSPIDFEIRTTYSEDILIPKDIEEIIRFLAEKDFKGRFVLQQYQYSEGVGEKYKDKIKKPAHIDLLNILEPYLNKDLNFELFLRDEVVGYSEIHMIFEKIL